MLAESNQYSLYIAIVEKEKKNLPAADFITLINRGNFEF